jgi:acetylornithine aminotransferase
MLAVEFAEKAVGDRIYDRLLEKGYIVCNRGGMFRVDPPLVIEEADFLKFVDVFRSLLDEA